MNQGICGEDKCTACEACVQVCPKNCISKYIREDDTWVLTIDEEKCIHCGKCKSVCPSIQNPKFHAPTYSYAAWRTNKKVHMQSASGGVATAFYEYAINKGMYVAGVVLNGEFEARFYLTNNLDDLQKFKNSKYTFSYAGDVYREIIDKLQEGEHILFIGLPCQVAGIKQLIRGKKYAEQLIAVDLVCHGTPTPVYLKQHIANIERTYKTRFEKCFFRDAKFDTSNFAYTLYTHNSEQPTYVKYVDEDDNYQIGYHNALIYRDVCYSCAYAKRERVGDITIGDYHGLGKAAPYNHEKVNVSCVVVNTDVGKEFIDAIQKNGTLTMYTRPVSEPLDGEKQFNRPSYAPEERNLFLRKYAQCKDFDVAADFAFKTFKRKNQVYKFFHVKQIKDGAIKLIPRSVKEAAKAMIRKIKK